MKDRVLKVFGNLATPADALVLANSVDPLIDHSFFYLFDCASGIFEGSLAIALPDGRLHVFSSPLEAESAYQAAKEDPTVTVHVPRPQEMEAEVRSILGSTTRIALNYHELTHESYLRLSKLIGEREWIDASAALRKSRVTKDAREIERLRRAAEIGSAVGREIPQMLRAGMTELELAAEMEYSMMKHGASGRSFATIVGFGTSGAEPHYMPRDKPLRSGESIVCDFGAFYRRYASDITRSFHFGRRDDELKRVHETVEAAQQAALSLARAGVTGKEIHNAAAQVIDASPWKGRFTHGLGHSIGLAVHDGFGMGPQTDDILQEGMAITIEPGIYLPGRGGVRIEDDILITRTGYEFLTTTPRGYLEVPA
jgi:Xaa-Pro dipeptidase